MVLHKQHLVITFIKIDETNYFHLTLLLVALCLSYG